MKDHLFWNLSVISHKKGVPLHPKTKLLYYKDEEIRYYYRPVLLHGFMYQGRGPEQGVRH